MAIRDRLSGALRAFFDPSPYQTTEVVGGDFGLGELYGGLGQDIPIAPGSEITKAQAQSWMVRLADNVGTALGRLRKAMVGQIRQEPKGHFLDPEVMYPNYGQFRERPSGLSFDTLRAMAYRTPVIGAVHQTRLNQIGPFGAPQSEPTEMGFIVLPKNPGERKNPTNATFQKIEELTDFFALTGTRYNDRHLVRDNLETVFRKTVRDSLTFDQYCLQLVPDRFGRPAEFFAMPAHSMRLATRDDEDGSWRLDPDEVHYVQVERGDVVEEFNARELLFEIRNPRSDLEVGGYGLSELELLVHTVTGMLWAEQYNYRFFSSGSTIKGILNVKGFLTREQLRAFRREWFALLSGVHNAWRTPIFNAEDVQFIPMHANNRDMEFIEWLYYLLKITTSVYQIDPSEINFQFGNEGQSVQVFESSNEAKTRLSRDRGLRPIVVKLQSSMNRIIEEIDPNFEIHLAGLDAKSEEQKAQLAEQLSRSAWTIDEVRDRLYGMPPLHSGGGTLRSTDWLAYIGQLGQLAAMEAGMGGDGGSDGNGALSPPVPGVRAQGGAGTPSPAGSPN